MKKYSFTLILVIFCSTLFSQQLKHEIGISAGLISMQTDYGERGHLPSSVANIGFGIGGSYYLSFDENRNRWSERTTWLKDHLRGKLELSYMGAGLKHRGKYVENEGLLKETSGSTKMLNVGGMLEINFFPSSDFRSWKPYASIGGIYSMVTPEFESTLGDIEDNPSLVPNAYRNGLYLEKDNASAFVIGAGSRYVKNNGTIFLVDFRWQRYFSDKVEGLVPQISANKHNDWLFYLNVGMVFRIN